MTLKILLSLTLILMHINSFAQGVYVKKLRGEVFAVKNNKKHILKERMKFTGPVDIFSGNKSYAIFSLDNNDQVTIGPNSNIYLYKKDKKTPSLISLVTGKIRAKVQKRKSDEHKLYIKTKSAALGVRGTDFILTYNDKNHITSNVTLNGSVDFYKETDDQILKDIKEGFDSTSTQKKKYTNYTEIKDKLSSKTVQINEGNFSGAFPTYDQPLTPTRVSPHQIGALGRTNFVSKNNQTINGKSSKKFEISNKNLIPEPIGKFEKNNENTKRVGDSTIRAGGVVDLDTGIYIMPPEGSDFDSKTGVYVLPKDYGGVNAESGEYVPPKNIKLDPYLGFMGFVDGTFKQIDEFGTSVNKLLNKYKKLTRVDLEADTRYFYSYKSYEDYYGEYRFVSPAESMILSFEGSIGRHIYNSKKYLHYLKASSEMIWHNRRDEPLVQRNDRLDFHYGYEFHYKHMLMERRANLIFELVFNTIYQDFKNKDQWDFYSESTKLGVYEKFFFSKNQSFLFGGFVEAFQGYVDRDHGNIWGVNGQYSFQKHLAYQFDFDYEFTRRMNLVDSNILDLNKFGAKIIKKNIFRKTDISLSYDYRLLNSLKTLAIDRSQSHNWKTELLHRRGEHFLFNVFYNYMENNSFGGNENRDFLQQLWGLGLKFKF